MTKNPLLEEKNKEFIASQLEIEVTELSDLLLDAVWEQIINYIGYNPLLQSREEYLEGNGIDKLYLNARPIKSIESLKINGNSISRVTFTDRYLNICTTKGDCQCENYLYDYPKTDKIEIKYTAGYENIPRSMMAASVMLLQSLISSTGEEGKLKNYKINTVSYTFKDFSEKSSEYQELLKSDRVI
ncbi:MULTISPECIES: hypothetical protein [Fusobacterium]|jgi:hypothetical protein|uniref:hypothetical protein n=1 Tax=Fusobacterium TaxID=848 RepID=UPI000E98E658|nr:MULTISPECIES: hypothetical protein [Fusobacterium]DAE77852.1 MAG TPA: hypothetical protein [Caudoviricetes sp.]HBJ79736.1 hypothetical protein [Fusobacterium sp.]